jgi:hypothetical protein
MAVTASAQQSRLGAEFEIEQKDLETSCSPFGFGKLAGCAEALFTEPPVHIAVGSLAPQNGFGAGVAFVYHWTTENWRNSLDVDAVASPNQSWRGGAYMTLVWIKRPTLVMKPGGSAAGKEPAVGKEPVIKEQRVFHLYAQTTSLNKLYFFGLGPNTTDTARSIFGMTETVVGGNVVWPIWQKLNASLLGEANGRFVDLRGDPNQAASIDQLYTPATAPGLANQPGFAQFGEAIRIRPSLVSGHIQLNYNVAFQEYVAASSKSSFERLTIDLQHQFPLYKIARSSLANESLGPDDCPPGQTPRACSGITRNLEGSFGIRFLMTQSFVPAGNVVPFYFQPTLGGSDINGTPALASYQDYRFRAPNNILARASFEHSIYNLPLGVTAMIDEGKVALSRSDLDFTHLRHSYSAGLTLRAGGFPVVYLLFSWGGHEGTHTSTLVDTSLLGSSTRPSLY